MTNPAISIIIPTYNREKLIIKALDSIFAQTFSDFEILIIDDASTDNTKEVIESLANPKIKYYKLDKNSGQCVARNYGIKRASGELIAFLDSDDEWLPEKLGSQMECFRKGPANLGVVYGYSYQKNMISNKLVLKDGPYYRGDIHGKFLEGFCPPTPSIFLVRKEALEKVNYFDENLITFVDLDLWIRLSEFYLFDYVEKPVIIKYEQIGDQYVNNFDKRSKGFVLFIKKWKKEVTNIKGADGFKNLKERLVYAVVVPILSHPPLNIRQIAGKILRLLLEVRSLRWLLYVKAFLFLMVGPIVLAGKKK